MISETDMFDKALIMIKNLSPQSRLKLMEEITKTFWDILPSKLEEKSEQSEWPPNFFEETAGAWQGEVLVRPAQEIYEERLELS